MNIFLHEMRSNFRSLLIWSGIIVLFVVVGFSKFSAFAGNEEMLALLDTMPPAMLSALNMNALNLTTVTGFYGVMFIYFSLLLTAAAVMWGSDIIVKEERDKTVEFALTLPVRRSQLITGKAAAVLVNCAALTLVTWAATLAGATPYEPDSQFFTFVALASAALFVMQIVFVAVGILLGCAMQRYKRANSAAVSVLLVAFFGSIVINMNDKLKAVKYLTPFQYFDPISLMREAQIPGMPVLIAIVVAVILMAGAYFAYAKRDLYI